MGLSLKGIFPTEAKTRKLTREKMQPQRKPFPPDPFRGPNYKTLWTYHYRPAVSQQTNLFLNKTFQILSFFNILDYLIIAVIEELLSFPLQTPQGILLEVVVEFQLH